MVVWLRGFNMSKEEAEKAAAEKAAAEKEEAEKEEAEKAAAEKEKASKSSKAFKVAKGKAVTSLKGILAEGAVVCPGYFAGGKEAFDSLIKQKCIVK